MKRNGNYKNSEICNLRVRLSEVYTNEGPTSDLYIELSNKLHLLLKEYYEDILLNIIEASKEELIKICKQKGHQHTEAIKASQKLDKTIIEYQKLKQLV